MIRPTTTCHQHIHQFPSPGENQSFGWERICLTIRKSRTHGQIKDLSPELGDTFDGDYSLECWPVTNLHQTNIVYPFMRFKWERVGCSIGVIPLSIVLLGWKANCSRSSKLGVWSKIQSFKCASKHFIMTELSTKGKCYPGCMLMILKHDVKPWVQFSWNSWTEKDWKQH